MEKLSKAKAALICDQPFFASLLLGMPMKESKEIPTMGTNGEYIVFNPDFVAKLTVPELVFVLAHETLHCVFQHMFRKGARNHAKWNIAADFVINDILVNESVGNMIKGGLYDPALVKRGGATSEGVYDLLPDSMEKNLPGTPGGSWDDCMDSEGTQAERSAKEAEMKVRVIQASNAAKISGKMSSNLERLVDEMVAPKVDWKSVLRRFISERAKVDLSYARPKRRYMADDFYLPSLNGDRMGAVVVAVDCSGSIDTKTLAEFAAELKSITSETRPTSLHVVYFDSEVLHVDKFSEDEEIQVNARGGGGTAFSPVFNYIDKAGLELAACVVLTDLQCSDFGPKPIFPVLWASNDQMTAPWGEIVKIND